MCDSLLNGLIEDLHIINYITGLVYISNHRYGRAIKEIKRKQKCEVGGTKLRNNEEGKFSSNFCGHEKLYKLELIRKEKLVVRKSVFAESICAPYRKLSLRMKGVEREGLVFVKMRIFGLQMSGKCSEQSIIVELAEYSWRIRFNMIRIEFNEFNDSFFCFLLAHSPSIFTRTCSRLGRRTRLRCKGTARGSEKCSLL